MAGDRERVWPLFGVLADVKSGASLKKNSFDGGSEVMSRVRRGVLSLRVVRQMLS